MLVEAFKTIIYVIIVLSLFAVDYLLGHGLLDTCHRVLCKMMCYVRRTLKEEAKQVQVMPEIPISFSILAIEVLMLSCTIAFLNKYKKLRGKDRIDELLNESKEALRQTNQFLEKWRLRRVPTEYSYLDEIDDEPQMIKPLKLEVPILHMAIIDTLGTARSKPERGDAGDIINFTDSTLLSLTSLIDDDLDSVNEQPDAVEEKVPDETKNIEFRNRYLWDVREEDVTNLED